MRDRNTAVGIGMGTTLESVCLFVCLSVYLLARSITQKMEDFKVFKLIIWHDLVMS